MSRSVLVVEDYPDLRKTIAEVLERDEYVCECVDEAGAIARLRENHYDRILIAARLPIASDPVLHFLVENQPEELDNVVVMLSPATEEEPRDSRWQTLKKPFSRDQLLVAVR